MSFSTSIMENHFEIAILVLDLNLNFHKTYRSKVYN